MTRNASLQRKVEYVLDLPEKYNLIEKGMAILLVLLIIWFIQMVMTK